MKGNYTNLKQSLKLKELGLNQEVQVLDAFFDTHEESFTLRLSFDTFGFSRDTDYFFSDDDRPDLQIYRDDHFLQSTCLAKSFSYVEIEELLPLKINVMGRKNEFYFNPHSEIPEYGYCSGGKRAIYCKGNTHLEAKFNLLVVLLEMNKI